MKKALLIATTFFTSLALNAQLTQANHAPANGDMYEMWQCDSVAPGAAGANVVWNFGTIATHSSIVRTNTAGTSTNTTYASANVSITTTPNNIVTYYNSSANSLSNYGGNISVGSGATAVIATLNYTAPAILATYPMSISTTSSAAIGGSLNVTTPLSTTGTFVGTSSTTADGTGTLILPGTTSTYTNVIRVVSSQTINFTTPFASGSLFQFLYEYYAAGTKAPILSIATATASTPLGTATQTIVTRNKNSVGTSTVPINTVGINNYDANQVNLQVYPNPASTLINFNTNHPDAQSLIIFDVTGKQVEKIKLAEGRVKLDVSAYNKGLYLYTLLSSNGKTLKSGKLTVSE